MDSTPVKIDIAAALAALSREELDRMKQAADSIGENLRLLKKSAQNMVGQCLANQGTFFEDEHYPKGDVYDGESHAQYYYHAHRPDSGEHGHFHTFLRSAGMPRTAKAVPYSGKAKRPTGIAALSHIVAVSMNRPGMPVGMFTTNRWVTDETFYPVEDVARMVDRFSIEQSYPCLATNRAITAVLHLFKPQVLALLQQRDRTIAAWAEKYPDRDVYEDRELEITSIIDINVEQQQAAVKKALRNAI